MVGRAYQGVTLHIRKSELKSLFPVEFENFGCNEFNHLFQVGGRLEVLSDSHNPAPGFVEDPSG